MSFPKWEYVFGWAQHKWRNRAARIMCRWEKKVQKQIRFNLSHGWRRMNVEEPHPELRNMAVAYLEALGFEVNVHYSTLECKYLKEI